KVMSFFFQVEDGIRADLVTGVQTCALPISDRGSPAAGRDRPRSARAGQRLRVWSDQRSAGAGISGGSPVKKLHLEGMALAAGLSALCAGRPVRAQGDPVIRIEEPKVDFGA